MMSAIDRLWEHMMGTPGVDAALLREADAEYRDLISRAKKAEAELARLREGIDKLHGLIEHIGGEPMATIRAQLAALLEVRE